jgi:hypothetical protein
MTTISTASIEISFISGRSEDVFEGGLEGMGGIDLGIGCFEKLQSWLSAGSSTHRSKVAEEMLLCEVIVQRRICPKHHQKDSLMRRAAGLREKLLCGSCRQTALDIQAYIKLICDSMSKQV